MTDAGRPSSRAHSAGARGHSARAPILTANSAAPAKTSSLDGAMALAIWLAWLNVRARMPSRPLSRARCVQKRPGFRLEPRFPACREALSSLRPALVVVDGGSAPSHGRAVASWMAGQPRYRTVPFLFVDVADREMARVKKELPRAQFATWSSVVGASDRLAKR